MADLRRLRSDLGTFAAAVGVPLAEWQVESLRLRRRITCIVASRQSGKSRSLGVLALQWAFADAGQRVLVVSASEEGAKRLLGEVRRAAAASHLLRGSVSDEASALVRLTNGSEMRSVPQSERAVRGWAVDLLLLDECALISDEVLSAALPVVAAREAGRVVMASSATTAEGGFYDHVHAGLYGSEHIETFRWVPRAAGGAEDMPWISASFIAAMRESMSALRFSAEFCGDFAGASDLLLPRRILEAATAPYTTTPLGTFGPAARLLLGVDWGWSRDRNAVVGLARFALPGAERVFGFATVQRWPAGHSTDGVIEEVAGSAAHYGLVVSESVGLGAPLTARLFQRLAQRERARGGGGPRRPVIVDAAEIFGPDWFRKPHSRLPRDFDWEDGMVAAAPGLRARPPGFRTRKAPLHTSTASKAAAWASIRQLTERGELLWPRGEEELLREAALLKVDLTASGGERIEASAGHDDLVDALAAATWPRPPAQRGQPWRTYLGSLADRRKPLPDAPLPAGASMLPTVEAPSGLLVPRDPVWQSPDGRELTVPASMPGPTEHDDLAHVRASVRAALANHNERTP